jgi:hypothetical protein
MNLMLLEPVRVVKDILQHRLVLLLSSSTGKLSDGIFAESFDHRSTRSKPNLLNFRAIGQYSGQRPCQRISTNLRRKKSGFFMRNLFNDAAAGDPTVPKTIIAAFSHATPCSEP